MLANPFIFWNSAICVIQPEQAFFPEIESIRIAPVEISARAEQAQPNGRQAHGNNGFVFRIGKPDCYIGIARVQVRGFCGDRKLDSQARSIDEQMMDPRRKYFGNYRLGSGNLDGRSALNQSSGVRLLFEPNKLLRARFCKFQDRHAVFRQARTVRPAMEEPQLQTSL